MKVKKGFMLRQLGNQYVVVALGDQAAQFKGMVRLNASGAFIWDLIANNEMSYEDIVDAMLQQYDIEKETACADVKNFLEILKDADLLEK